MSIIIGADIVPSKSNSQFFEQGNTNVLIGKELLDVLQTADYRVFNLETPLGDTKNLPIKKDGANFIASSKTVNGIKKINPDLLTLANNHIMDYGESGLSSTYNALKEASIAYLGVGKNLDEASRPFIVEIKGRRFGFYACAENEFSIAKPNQSGANPFDPLKSFDHIRELCQRCDYAIILYHGGKERYCYPSPYLQKICRKIVECGASLVVCQHSHCIGCQEKWQNGVICYGQGNFIFCKKDRNIPCYHTSLLININDSFEISYIPICATEYGTRLANKEEKESILDDFQTRSIEILTEGFVEKNYRNFARMSAQAYLRTLTGKKSFAYRLINKFLGNALYKNLYNQEDYLKIMNVVRCEAHRELLLEGISAMVQDDETSPL